MLAKYARGGDGLPYIHFDEAFAFAFSYAPLQSIIDLWVIRYKKQRRSTLLRIDTLRVNVSTQVSASARYLRPRNGPQELGWTFTADSSVFAMTSPLGLVPGSILWVPELYKVRRRVLDLL